MLAIILAVVCCAADKPLSIEDFVLHGPLGSDGASITQKGPEHFEMSLGHAPTHEDWSNKAHFTLHNAKGKTLQLDVVFPLGGSYSFNEYFYSWSYDGQNWHPVHWEKGYKKDKTSDTLRFPKFEQDTVYVGHQVPMSYEDLRALAEAWKANPAVSVTAVGKSLEGRDILRITITDPASPHPPETRWGQYFINQHPGEHNAQWRMAGMIDWLLSEAGADCRQRMICHFILMMSPDAPSHGWYRVNAQGVDMNRSYFVEGSNADKQAHEAFLCQRDLEQLMASKTPPVTVWSMHTWGGNVEPILRPGPEIEKSTGPWTDLRDITDRNDPEDLVKTLAAQPAKAEESTHWDQGPHLQFGVTNVLCEGAGAIDTKEANKASGVVIIKSLAEYYSGLRPR